MIPSAPCTGTCWPRPARARLGLRAAPHNIAVTSGNHVFLAWALRDGRAVRRLPHVPRLGLPHPLHGPYRTGRRTGRASQLPDPSDQHPQTTGNLMHGEGSAALKTYLTLIARGNTANRLGAYAEKLAGPTFGSSPRLRALFTGHHRHGGPAAVSRAGDTAILAAAPQIGGIRRLPHASRGGAGCSGLEEGGVPADAAVSASRSPRVDRVPRPIVSPASRGGRLDRASSADPAAWSRAWIAGRRD